MFSLQSKEAVEKFFKCLQAEKDEVSSPREKLAELKKSGIKLQLGIDSGSLEVQQINEQISKLQSGQSELTG